MIQRIKEWFSQFDQMTDEEFLQYLKAKLQQAINAIKGWSRMRKVIVASVLFWTLLSLIGTIKDIPTHRPFLIQWAVNFAAGFIAVFYTVGVNLVGLAPVFILIWLAWWVFKNKNRRYR